MARVRKSETSVVTFIAGAAFGAGIALLLAPKSGKDLQGTLQYTFDDFLNKIRKILKSKSVENDLDVNPPTHV